MLATYAPNKDDMVNMVILDIYAFPRVRTQICEGAIVQGVQVLSAWSASLGREVKA